MWIIIHLYLSFASSLAGAGCSAVHLDYSEMSTLQNNNMHPRKGVWIFEGCDEANESISGMSTQPEGL